MKHEIKLIAEQIAAAGGMLRPIEKAGADPQIPVGREETLIHRKSIRETTDNFILEKLGSSDPRKILHGICEVMMALAGLCATTGIEPSSSELLIASKELLEDSRVLIDKGIQIGEWDQVRIGVAMSEIVLCGLAARLNMPYLKAFGAVLDSYYQEENSETTMLLVLKLNELLRENGYEIKIQETPDAS